MKSLTFKYTYSYFIQKSQVSTVFGFVVRAASRGVVVRRCFTEADPGIRTGCKVDSDR